MTVLVGANAVGKTNVVEGIQLLTALSSFRGAPAAQLVRTGESSARIAMRASGDGRELDVECLIDPASRKYRLNGKPKRPADLKGLVPSVTFTPDDLEMVKGSMGVRRRAVDVLGSQLNANYHLIRRDYEKVIRHKNRLLKEEASYFLLESVNDMLVTCGAQLVSYRSALFCRLASRMESLYEKISAGRERFSASYEYSWADLPIVQQLAEGDEGSDCASFGEDETSSATCNSALHGEASPIAPSLARAALTHALAARSGEERARRRCLVGPHLDQMRFALDGLDASRFASQGQQRSIVLAEKLAEAYIIEEMLGQKPVLLLDDVMSELDGNRRAALVDYLTQDVQAFITTANLAYFDQGMLDRARVVKLPLQNGGGDLSFT